MLIQNLNLPKMSLSRHLENISSGCFEQNERIHYNKCFDTFAPRYKEFISKTKTKTVK